MAKELLFGQMVVVIRDNISKTKKMAMESLNGLMVYNTLENSKMVYIMEKHNS